jgi:hypothetical protein
MIVFITMHVATEICTWARPPPPDMGNLAIIPGFRGKLWQVVGHFWRANPGNFSRVPKPDGWKTRLGPAKTLWRAFYAAAPSAVASACKTI